MFHAIAAFLSGVTVDVLATLVFHFTSKNRTFAAASSNTLLTALFIYVFVDITKENYIAIPYLFGIWIGGIVGMTLKKSLEKI